MSKAHLICILCYQFAVFRLSLCINNVNILTITVLLLKDIDRTWGNWENSQNIGSIFNWE